MRSAADDGCAAIFENALLQEQGEKRNPPLTTRTKRRNEDGKKSCWQRVSKPSMPR
jgi:hypothetical protein